MAYLASCLLKLHQKKTRAPKYIITTFCPQRKQSKDWSKRIWLLCNDIRTARSHNRTGIIRDMPFVRIAVNLPAISGEYDYQLPDSLSGIVAAGHLVTVPFGAQIVQGIVLETISQPAVAQTRAVIDLMDANPVLTNAQIEFARQLARETLNPLAAIVDLMIPPGLSQRADMIYQLTPDRGRWTVDGLRSTVHHLPSLRMVLCIRLVQVSNSSVLTTPASKTH